MMPFQEYSRPAKLLSLFLLLLFISVLILWENNFGYSKSDIETMVAAYPTRISQKLAFATKAIDSNSSRGGVIKYDIFGQWKSEKKDKVPLPNVENNNQTILEKEEKVNKDYNKDGLTSISLQSNVKEEKKKQEIKSDQTEKGKGKYSVISASTPIGLSRHKYNYVFYLPLTVLAWHRLGYTSIIFISGSQDSWEADPVLNLVLSYVKDLGALLHFLPTEKRHLIMISQTSRLFAACIFDNLDKDDHIILSDADIWPLNSEMYNMPSDKQLMILNAYCCGDFKHKDEKFRMYPIANIAANANTWKQIITQEGNRTCPSNASMILDYFAEEFGDIARHPVEKGENDGWFLDQHMISVRIVQWIRTLTTKNVLYFVERNTGWDRLDRINWAPRRLGAMTDTHLLGNLFEVGQWVKVQPLLVMMYEEASTYHTLCQRYRDEFDSVRIKSIPKTTVPPTNITTTTTLSTTVPP